LLSHHRERTLPMSADQRKGRNSRLTQTCEWRTRVHHSAHSRTLASLPVQMCDAITCTIGFSIASCFDASGTPYTRTMKTALSFLTYKVTKFPTVSAMASSPTPFTAVLVTPGS